MGLSWTCIAVHRSIANWVKFSHLLYDAGKHPCISSCVKFLCESQMLRCWWQVISDYHGISLDMMAEVGGHLNCEKSTSGQILKANYGGCLMCETAQYVYICYLYLTDNIHFDWDHIDYVFPWLSPMTWSCIKHEGLLCPLNSCLRQVWV